MQGNHTADNGAGRLDFSLHHDAWGRLVLVDAAGQHHVGVEPVRCFPISDPRHSISLCDAEGHEVLWINSLDELAQPLRKMLEGHLGRREFMPIVHRIVTISSSVEPSEWEIETDRGKTRFPVKSAEDVRRLDEQRAIIVDGHGIRYLIPDIQALDARSRRLLKRYL